MLSGVPEIDVQDDYGYTMLYDGTSTVAMGDTTQGSPVSRSFTIYNSGDEPLTLQPAFTRTGVSMSIPLRRVTRFRSAAPSKS
jgi:hypothetical protein